MCFSGAINPGSLKGAIQFMAANGSGASININQAIYDPVGNCAYAKPDHVLAEDTRYLLLVNNTLKDAGGNSVVRDPAFTACLSNEPETRYCSALSASVTRVGGTSNLLAASLFTTLSATDWLEKARRFADAGPAIALPAGFVSVFPLNNVSSISYVPQDNSGKHTTLDIPKSALAGVESIAFGLYLSPNFTNISGVAAGTINVSPTNGPIGGPVQIPGLNFLLPPGYVPISYHVFLPPASQKRAGGFPVAIYGHGLGDTQFGAPTFIASTLAKQGIATLAIEIPGHGFGPLSYVKVVNQYGVNFVTTPGRGVPLSAGGTYGSTDGCIVPGPFAVRDCGRQTAVDLSALVHTIQGTRGLGLNLDPAQISYIGQSFGGTYGTLFHAVEPEVGRAVLNGAGGPSVDISRLAISGRPLGGLYLATHNPPLPNVPPAMFPPYFHGLFQGPIPFNDNYVLRDVSPVVNTVPGALPIQAAFEEAEWLGMLGDPLAFAPHLKTSHLAGVPAKTTLFQFGYGDLEVPNPTESAVVRAADGLDTTWLFHFELALLTHPELAGVMEPGNPLPLLPHRYLSNPTIFGVPAEQSVALATQMQAGKFLLGDPNPNPNPLLTSPFAGVPLFENSPVLPEQLNFIQIPK